MEEGRFYHIFNRGINRENIFKEEENYFFFLRKYGEYLSDYVDTYAYCLMPNHFHFLIKVKEQENNSQTSKVFKTLEVLPPSSSLTPIEKAFKDFFISYSKSINKKYDRTGSLFQKIFKRKMIDNEIYLKQLIIYIHLNPVMANFSDKISDWNFSSYNSILKNTPTKIKRDEVLDWFNDKDNFEYCHKTKLETEKLKDYLFDE